MKILPWKIIRWSYVAPRLLILFVLYLVGHFATDPLVKWIAITSGESSLGAKVELAELCTSFWRGTAEVRGLALANPQSPMRNLLEVADSQLQIDTNALLHGRVVISDGIVSGVQFDTDRESSGALENTEAEDTEPSVLDPLLASASELGDQWLDDMGDRLDTDVTEQLQSPRLAKALQDRWPQQYEQLKSQVESIRTRGKALQTSIEEVKANPLRGLERLGPLTQEVSTLQREVKSVQQQIGNLPKQAEADRQAILAAREQDEALLREKLQLGTLDGEGLTQTLLGKPVTDGLATALGWISWAREQMPAGAPEPETRGRGTTVLFTPPRPDYLVKRLQLEGSAQMGGQPLQLVGTITGASSAPHLFDEPTVLRLHGSEAIDMNVDVQLDRRGEIACDRLQISCPKLAMAGRTLGNADKLAIDMGAGVADFRVKLELVGDDLDGEIVFLQDALQVTPRMAKAPNAQIAEALKAAMASVNQLQANVTLAGTLQKPQVKIDSDIGDQVAAGLNSTLKRMVQGRTEALMAKSRAQVDEQLGKLTQMREQAQQELLGQLGEGQELLGQLAKLTGGGPGGIPAGIPQIGKSLRLGDILKK